MDCKICGKKMLRTNFKKHFRAVHESVLCLFCKEGFKQCSSVYDLTNAPLMKHYNKLMMEHMMIKHKVVQNFKFMLFGSALSSGEMNVINHFFDYKSSVHKDKKVKPPSEKIQDVLKMISWDCDKFTCLKCGSKSKEKSKLLTHIIQAHDSFRLKCKLCDYKAYEQVKMKRHMRKLHDLDGGPIYFYCKLCEYKTDDNQNLKRHIRENHEEEHNPDVIKCEECPYKTKKKDYFKRHLKVNHKGPKQQFNCSKCDYKAAGRTTLNIHDRRIHLGLKEKYPCDVCKYEANSMKNLKVHTQSPHIGTKHLCEKCEYVGNSKQVLEVTCYRFT